MFQDLLDKFNHCMLIFKNIECLEFPDLQGELHLGILLEMVHDHIDVHDIVAGFDLISDFQFIG